LAGVHTIAAPSEDLSVDSLPQPQGQPAPFVFASPEQATESSFDFWGVLNRRKWLVFLGLVSGMALGTLYDAQCETVYKSEARVKIEPKDPLYLPMSQSAMMLPGASDMTIRHDQLIGQYNIVERCLLKNKLTKLRSFENLTEADIVPEVIDNLSITQNKEEQILYELVYYSSRPDDAQTILNHLIATYEMNLEEQYKTETDKVSSLLKSMHKEFTGNYKTLQAGLDKAHQDNQAIIVSVGQLTLHQVRVGALEKVLAHDQNDIQFFAKDLERAQAALSSNSDEIEKTVWIFKEQGKIKDDGKRLGGNREMELIEAKIRDLKGDERRLLGTFGKGHKQVKILQEDIKEWEKSLAEVVAEGEFGAVPIEPEEILRRYVDSLNQQIYDLQASIEINQQALIEHSIEAARIANVRRRVETIESQMDTVREFVEIAKKKLIEIDSGDNASRQEGFRFQKLQDANYGEPVWPILFVILGIGGLLGSVAGFGLGCLVELADKTFHNPDEIMKQLNTPLIGHIPVIGQSKRYLVENSLIEPIICTYHRPKSQVSEAFRAVRTALYFNTQGRNHAVIQVTSPTPGDGKSTLASNLAVSIAQSGKRVLLVDADMRRPRQHTTFGISSKEGFSTVLSGQSQWREVMYECEEIEGLTIMPCGAKPNNPAELSSSPQVKVLIEEMREEFDFVIIDTPPLLAVTDPCPIAARVDGVILCLRIKKNVRVSAERSSEMLNNLGAKCIGLVVNGVGAQSGYGSQYTYGAYRAGYSYNGYGYGYGYGNRDEDSAPAPEAG
jgi:succinoglycan biosynthesis transport protein ExoP